jgi:U3 small nucleolar RNA-associated protein 13
VFGHADIVLTMSIRNELLITGSKDNTIKLWSIRKGKLIQKTTYKGHSKNVTSINFAPKKGRFFVSASKDLTIKIWSIIEKEKSEITEAMRTTIAHTKDINAVKVSPNDKIIASGSQDRTIKVNSTLNHSYGM